MLVNSAAASALPGAMGASRRSSSAEEASGGFASRIGDVLREIDESADPYRDVKLEMRRRQASRKLELERSEKQAAAIERVSTKKSETEELLERLRVERARQNTALKQSERRTALTEEASKNRQAVEAANRAGEKPLVRRAPVEFHGVSAAELLDCL